LKLLFFSLYFLFRFYEWQTAKPGKQPYFITFADDSSTKEAVKLSKDDDDFDDDTKSSPFKGRLLTMAGYFDIWRPASGVSYYMCASKEIVRPSSKTQLAFTQNCLQ